MSHRRRLARLLQELEGRVTDLESDRPPDAPETRVMNVTEDLTLDDSVTMTKKTDFTFKYDTSGNGYDESEWA